MHAFKNIEFAVHCSPRDDRNFKIFERVLKPERERVYMKEKLPEKKVEVAKTNQTGNIRYQARRRRRLWDNAQRPLKEVNGRLGQSSGCPNRL